VFFLCAHGKDIECNSSSAEESILGQMDEKKRIDEFLSHMNIDTVILSCYTKFEKEKEKT